MFLCWGYSIHARRRVQVFIDDPRFEVTVASTYNYGFAGARNVQLSDAKIRADLSPARERAVLLLPPSIRIFLRKLLNLLMIGFELKKMRHDLNIVSAAVRRYKPDIVFLQTLQYPSFLALFLPKNLKMAVTFWNGDLTHFAKWTGIEMIAKKQIVKFGLRRMDAITVNSRTALDAAVRLGALPEKIALIRYPGVDLKRFYPRPKDIARKRLGISERYVVLCPRGLGKFFNSDIIVEAGAKVVRSYSDILLLFVSGVGGRTEWNRHLRLAEKLDIEEQMRWDGEVPWEEMPWYYSAADVMISIMNADSCPNCMLEAMACATPVVMSDTRQNREWIKDGLNGFLCPPRNPVIVAERLIKTIENRDGLVNAFTRNCLTKIERDANSAVNMARIKTMIAGLARSQKNGSG